MRDTHYIDEKGRYWKVRLPDNVPDSDANLGIPVGPPSLEALGLPEEVEISLHNHLYSRGIFSSRDVEKRRGDVQGAIQSALKLNTQKIHAIYIDWEKGNTEHKESTTAAPKRGHTKGVTRG